jgi:hypothetical protein
MGRKAKSKAKAKTIHCFWCGQDIEVNPKGRLRLHWGGARTVQCVGSGQPSVKVEAHNKLVGRK